MSFYLSLGPHTLIAEGWLGLAGGKLGMQWKGQTLCVLFPGAETPLTWPCLDLLPSQDPEDPIKAFFFFSGVPNSNIHLLALLYDHPTAVWPTGS